MRQAKLSCAQPHLTQSGVSDTLRLVGDEKRLISKYSTGRKSPYLWLIIPFILDAAVHPFLLL